MSDTSGERSEKATDKRMKESREKGRIAKSKDLTAWLGVGAAALMLPTAGAIGAQQNRQRTDALAALVAHPDPLVALDVLGQGLKSVMTILAPVFIAVVVVTVLGAAVQGGVHLKKFELKAEHLNVASGVKRIFGMQAVWEGVKALLKTLVVGLVLVVVIQGLMPVLTSAGGLSVAALLEAASGGTYGLLQAAIVSGLVLAAIDVFVVMKRNRKHTRMTKKEVKDENKNTEGDPLIKSQRRSRQLALSRNRMIAAVADADVVLVNPTHIAVAIRYQPGKSAPRVVAKGADNIALKIRAAADKSAVPIVRDIPLARALHATCELNHEIPVELYEAVARVLAFVMALHKRGSAAARQSQYEVLSPQPKVTVS